MKHVQKSVRKSKIDTFAKELNRSWPFKLGGQIIWDISTKVYKPIALLMQQQLAEDCFGERF